MEKIQEFILRYKIFFLVFVLCISLLIVGLGFIVMSRKNTSGLQKKTVDGRNGTSYDNKASNQVSQTSQNSLNSESSYIYFTKTNSPDSLTVYKSDGFSIMSTMQLPFDIRSITPLKNSDLLLIANLGFLDRGKTIEKFSNLSQKSLPVVDATIGYEIENYIVAPSDDAVVFWEVEENKSTEGQSHVVYQSLIDASNRVILIDEALNDQTKYPVLWLSNRNSILLDSYSVNRKGLYQGLFEVSLTDNHEVTEVLQKDAYSQTPVVVNGNSTLVFTSYNPSAKIQLPSPAVPNGLFRGIIRNPNEIRTIDLATKQIKTLISVEEGILYSRLVNPTSGSLVFFLRGKISGNEFLSEKTQWIDLANGSIGTLINRPDATMIGVFKGKIIVGFGTGTLGNVGGIETSYSQLYNGVYFFDPNTQTYEKILSDGDITIIGIK